MVDVLRHGFNANIMQGNNFPFPFRGVEHSTSSAWREGSNKTHNPLTLKVCP